MLIVLRGQEAATLQRNAHDLQIVGLDDVLKRPFHLRWCRWLCFSIQPERQRTEGVRHRYGTHTEGRRLEARNDFEVSAQLPPHSQDLVRTRVRSRLTHYPRRHGGK